ncbi:MAG: hypothetical protein U0517_00245 [Candidatus Andersenbacteria bacterium]
MALVAAALIPGPEQGSAKIQAGVEAAKKLFVQKKVDHILVLSGQAPSPSHAYTTSSVDPAAYYAMGLDKLQLTDGGATAPVFENDVAFVAGLKERARPFGLRILTSPTIKIDRANSRALRALEIGPAVKLVAFMLPYKAPKELFEFGRVLGAVAQQSQGNVAVLAAGNLSARLSKEGSAGFDPAGKQYDTLVTEAAKKNDFMPLLKADPTLLEKAGQESAGQIAVIAAATMRVLKASLQIYEAAGGTGQAVLTWS